MKSIFLCNQLAILKSILPPVPEQLTFLILEENEVGREVRDYLKRRGHALELRRAVLNRERSLKFRSEYVKSIGRLNVDEASLLWWAMPFTNKNPLATSLCRDTFDFLLIVEIVLNHSSGILIVVTDRIALAGQIKCWAKTQDISVTDKLKPKWTVKTCVNRVGVLRFTLHVARMLLHVVRVLLFKLWVRADGWEQAWVKHHDVLMVTVVEPNSIAEKGQFRDTYFGRLAEWLRGHKVSVELAHSFKLVMKQVQFCLMRYQPSPICFYAGGKLFSRIAYRDTDPCLS